CTVWVRATRLGFLSCGIEWDLQGLDNGEIGDLSRLGLKSLGTNPTAQFEGYALELELQLNSATLSYRAKQRQWQRKRGPPIQHTNCPAQTLVLRETSQTSGDFYFLFLANTSSHCEGNRRTSSVWINNTIVVESVNREASSVLINSTVTGPTGYLSKSRSRRIFESLLAEVISLAFSVKNPKAETCSFLGRSREIQKSAAHPTQHQHILLLSRARSTSWHARIQPNDVVSSLVTRPTRHVGLVVFRVNRTTRSCASSIIIIVVKYMKMNFNYWYYDILRIESIFDILKNLS
ncbi:hypothetical protein DVH24_007332, partial [Malus domestica]